jgi:hypothetical protein
VVVRHRTRMAKPSYRSHEDQACRLPKASRLWLGVADECSRRASCRRAMARHGAGKQRVVMPRSSQCAAILRRVPSPPGEGSQRQNADVSRIARAWSGDSAVHTAARNCTRDGGRPFGFGDHPGMDRLTWRAHGRPSGRGCSIARFTVDRITGTHASCHFKAESAMFAVIEPS